MNRGPDGLRVVSTLKRDATAEVVMNQLYRFTPIKPILRVTCWSVERRRPEQLTSAQVLLNIFH